MNLGELFNYINYLINRDQLGNEASPEQFEMLMKKYNNNLFVDTYKALKKELVEKGIAAAELFLSESAIKDFAKEKSWNFQGITSTVINLPDDFSRSVFVVAFTNNNWRIVEEHTRLQFDKLRNSIFRVSPRIQPFCLIENGFLRVIPTNLSKVKLVYFRGIKEPVFDYCLDQYDNIIYMPEDSVIKQESNVLNLYKSDNTLIMANVVFKTETLTAPYTSKSQEVEYSSDFDDYFIKSILSDALFRTRENTNVQ